MQTIPEHLTALMMVLAHIIISFRVFCVLTKLMEMHVSIPAAFVIAYLVLQFLIGKPMYFMELVLGQYSGKGPTGIWRLNPCAKGGLVYRISVSFSKVPQTYFRERQESVKDEYR